MQDANRTESIVSDQTRGDSGGRNGSAFDDLKQTVAGGLRGVASTLRRKGGSSASASVGEYAGLASNWLERAADQVSDVNPAQIKSDIQRKVRENPGRSLLVAGAAGLVLGILVKRR